MKIKLIKNFMFCCVVLMITTIAHSETRLDSARVRIEVDSIKTWADSLQKAGQQKIALENYQAALLLYQQLADHKKEVDVLLNMAIIYRKLADYSKALNCCEQSLKLSRAIHNLKGESDCLNCLGLIYKHQAEYSKAIESFQQALTIAQECHSLEREAVISSNMAIVHRHLADYPEALKHAQRSLEIGRQLDNDKTISVASSTMGSIFTDLSDFPNAIKCHLVTLEFARNSGNEAGEAIAAANLGSAYKFLANYPKSLEYLRKALELNRQLGNHNLEATILMNIGVVYVSLVEYDKARDYLSQSFKVFKELKNRASESSACEHLGSVYVAQGQLQEAKSYFDRSLELNRLIGEKRIELDVLTSLGNLHVKEGNFPEAFRRYQESLSLAQKINDRHGECVNLLSLGEFYKKQKEFKLADYNLRRALTIAQVLGTENLVQMVYSSLGNCSYAQGRYHEADGFYVNAIDLVEKIRGRLEVETQRTSYAASASDTYQHMILTLLNLKQPRRAFDYAERSRARSFLDIMASSELTISESSHKSTLDSENESGKPEEKTGNRLNALTDDLALTRTFRGDSEEQSTSRKSVADAKKRYQPELASLVSVNPLNSQEVQKLLDRESTLIDYYLTDDKTIIWVLTTDSIEAIKVDVNNDKLKRMVDEFRDAITALGSTEALSKDLYQALFAPIQKKIKTNKLVIIPHGILNYLPFEALQNPEGRYLVEDFEITYLPSASVKKYLEYKKRTKKNRLLAMGNPLIRSRELPTLKLAEQEVQDIAQIYPSHKVLIGSQATEEFFKQSAADYDIIHLACHSKLNSAYPLFSGLLLAPSGAEDGELETHEIFSLDLEADLVVLSACQTGLGHLTTGDELVGLTRAFIYAGTPTIVSSLWMVEDESTAFLMTQFYTNLKKYNKAESLQKAQLETKARYPDVHSWAAFVLIGDSE